MKKISKLLVGCLFVIVGMGIVSCEKNKLSAEDNVLGKWFVEKRQIKTINDGEPSIFDYPVTPSDYFSFKSENTYISSFGGIVSSGTYLLLNEQLIVLNNDTASILKLSKKEFHLRWKTVSADQSQEISLQLKK